MSSPVFVSPIESDLGQEVRSLHARLTCSTDAQILGVEEGADSEALRAAYHRLVRRYHPDSAVDADAELKRVLPSVFMRVVEAYQTLRPLARVVAVPSSRSGGAPVPEASRETVGDQREVPASSSPTQASVVEPTSAPEKK